MVQITNHDALSLLETYRSNATILECIGQVRGRTGVAFGLITTLKPESLLMRLFDPSAEGGTDRLVQLANSTFWLSGPDGGAAQASLESGIQSTLSIHYPDGSVLSFSELADLVAADSASSFQSAQQPH